MLQNSNTIQPKVVVIRRRPNQGFGFTVRHFIAYPPEDDPSWPQEASDPYQVKAMETIFIKEVQPNGPAHFANLQTGDRVLMVNNKPIAGIAYSTVVSMIKQTPSMLTLHVVPKECDVLQMHYSIAHTPESNRLTAVGQKPITTPINVGNGNVAASGATTTTPSLSAGATGITGAKSSSTSSSSSSSSPYPLNHHQLQQPQQQQPLISYPPPVPAHQKQLALVAATRSGSITSTTSGNLRAMPSSTASGGGAAAIDFVDMTPNFHHGRLLMRGGSGDAGCAASGPMRSQPPSLSVLTRQQQLQHQQLQNPAFISGSGGGVAGGGGGGPADTNDLMIRLRESIKQKEEFLKSPLPHAAGSPQQQQPGQQQQQHFFPHTPPQAASPQMSVGPASLSSSSSGATSNGSTARHSQVRSRVGSGSPLSGRGGELLPSSCDMQTFYAKNLPGDAYENAESLMQRRSLQNVARMQRQTPVGNGNLVSTLRDKYSKDFDYMESLQETGVTNKFFERKLVSHMSKGFDPFKPLSIQTNAMESASSSAAPGNTALLKKPGVLYDSLQHHPLHQLQMQQIQKTTVQPRVHHMAHSSNTATVSGAGLSAVDGQQHSRMEIHKASVAKLTSDHFQDVAGTKYTGNTDNEDKLHTSSSSTVAALTDIAESSDFASLKASDGASSSSSSGVVRRFKPVSSFDDSKPMRRISYLRATNNENDYQSDNSSMTTTTTTTNSTGGDGGVEASNSGTSQIQHHHSELTKEQSEEDSDPTYDVVGDARENLDELSLDAEEEADDAVADGAVASTNGREMVLVPTLTIGSRRASLNSEMRNSIHIESLSLENNGKLETKDVATEIEIFETEMEIKSSCINGKRHSEYRSWRQVKIEIKGDILKIYPSRHSKSESNVIELDIRNFQFIDESVDKKKYIFRMVSKPNTHLPSLANELTIEDATDKLTSSGTSSSTVLQIDQQQHTEILFKTKSITEMRRIFGLLQWKNSLIYDDSDLQGKQLAEPQKTAATSSVPTTATYCDESVQQQHQQLQPEYSPQSCASLEPTDSISPSMKARKSSSHKNLPEKDLGSPKAKNWKDLLFRRGGGSGSSGGSHSADISPSSLSSSAKTVGSIGVPLRSCPMSKSNEFVPHIVDVCTSIVESKGLGIVGIYRIPGNKAAISELSDQVNKTDFSWDRCNTDVRWEDVNVVSSLLKLFIRSLPDALLPSSYYINFIEADKKTGLVRLRDLKEILESLPRHSYETMKHLIRHLHRVSKNCEVNLMEPKNLAIIFGPSIIRTPNDTLEIAVKDMKHQCRIVELLVTQYEYFFENGSTPDIADISGNNPAVMATGSTSAAGQSQEEQTNMLLHNVSKIERLTERETTRTSRFIPQLRRRAHGNKRGAVANSDTYSGESVLSLDDAKSSHTTSTTTTASSSSSSSTMTALISSKSSSGGTALAVKKKERGGFLHHGIRTHKRNSSLDEKDSGSASGGSGGSSTGKDQQRSSVDMSAHLSDEESSNSRISDTGSMSLTTITDTLDTKLRNLRSGSESNDENGSPEFPKNRRHTFGQPLHLHSENIPYADESPERLFHSSCPLDAANALMLSRSCTGANTLLGGKVGSAGNIALLGEKHDKEQRPHTLSGNFNKAGKLQHSATAPIPPPLSTPPTASSTPTAVVTVKAGLGALSAGGVAARNSYMGKNLRFSSSVYEQCCSEDDSEGSTTSDPKESLIIASPAVFLDRYNKKRRDHRLFRSASFNSRNYSSRHFGAGGGGGVIVTPAQSSGLTKDEKTDMNLTKKRQIQNKQNRSIKRRHTVGGPHDYAAGPTQAANATTGAAYCAQSGVSACGHHCRGVSSVLRRISIPTTNGSNGQSSDGSLTANVNVNGSNGSVGNNSGAAGAGAAGGGEHVLEVGIRIKNINRSRY